MDERIARLEAYHDWVHAEALAARQQGYHELASSLMDTALAIACLVDNLRLAAGEML